MRLNRILSLSFLALLHVVLLNTGCSHQQKHWRADKGGAGFTHIVEKGDTLFALSKQYGVSVDEIAQANSLDRTASLKIGQPIFLPRVDEKTLEKRARDRIVNPDKSGETLPGTEDTRSISLAWPVEKGVLFRTFDPTPTRLHEGLSIGAPLNTPVFAAQDGEIIFAADANNHFGRMVIVKHDDPFVSIYGHLNTINVSVGKKVKKGEIIGTVGSSGGVESPRVYFQLRKNRTPVNPEPFLSSRG